MCTDKAWSHFCQTVNGPRAQWKEQETSSLLLTLLWNLTQPTCLVRFDSEVRNGSERGEAGLEVSKLNFAQGSQNDLPIFWRTRFFNQLFIMHSVRGDGEDSQLKHWDCTKIALNGWQNLTAFFWNRKVTVYVVNIVGLRPLVVGRRKGEQKQKSVNS